MTDPAITAINDVRSMLVKLGLAPAVGPPAVIDRLRKVKDGYTMKGKTVVMSDIFMKRKQEFVAKVYKDRIRISITMERKLQ